MPKFYWKVKIILLLIAITNILVIVDCIYKHPYFAIEEFNVIFEQTMEKISAENKEICLLGDFTIVLLKIDAENTIDEYYNIMRTNFLMSHNSSY